MPNSNGRAYVFLDGGRYADLVSGRGTNVWSYGVGLASETVNQRVVVDLGFAKGSGFRDGRLHARVEQRF